MEPKKTPIKPTPVATPKPPKFILLDDCENLMLVGTEEEIKDYISNDELDVDELVLYPLAGGQLTITVTKTLTFHL